MATTIRSNTGNGGMGGWLQSMSRRQVVGQVLVYILLIAIGFALAVPFLWLVSSSFKTETDAFRIPPSFIPRPIEWGNYATGLTDFPFVRSTVNTLIIVVWVMVGTVLSASLVAYGFARVRFPGRTALFILVLSTMMIPTHVTLIPQYLLFRELRWLDSFKPLIVPHFFGGGAFYIFLLRQFFLTIPLDYDDAARIDGCGTFGVFLRIILPLSKPALGTMAIFTFMGQWNAFFEPLIYLNRFETQPLAVALTTWVQTAHGSTSMHYVPWVAIMAVSTLIALPPVMVFFFAQRHFIQGVVVSGMKG
ncbi:MAG: carbohydrate ABC transporter permease [Caldilineaceae bacterium]|nr:carbohydrate ABC transporter permease [Caldilineaceae bacterium]